MEDEVRKFYNQYGQREWDRLDLNVYNRINFILHMDFIKDCIFKGAKVLDAGCGAGRYAIEFAKMGCDVTLFDISEEQLGIAKEKIKLNNLETQVSAYIRGDIRDLSILEDETFDMVICYGAPLSYVLERRDKAVSEFRRVLKQGGKLAISVNNKWGILKMLLGNEYPGFFENPEYWFINEVIKTGNLPRHEKVNQPPRHFFESEELKGLLSDEGFKNLILAGSPCFSCGNIKQVEELSKNETAYKTILEIERKTYMKPSMIDNGEFLLIKGIK